MMVCFAVSFVLDFIEMGTERLCELRDHGLWISQSAFGVL